MWTATEGRRERPVNAYPWVGGSPAAKDGEDGMSGGPTRRPTGSLRIVHIALFGPLSFFFGVIALSNMTDLLAAMGITLGSWRSGNIAYAQEALASVGWGPGLAFWVVLGASICEGIATLGYGVAAARLILGRPGVVPAVRIGTAGAFLSMIGLAWGIELFLVFVVADWMRNIVIALMAGTAWIAAEMTLRDLDDAQTAP